MNLPHTRSLFARFLTEIFYENNPCLLGYMAGKSIGMNGDAKALILVGSAQQY